VQIEDDVDHDGDDQEQEGDHGKDVDLVTDALEIFEELLLFEGVAVGGFANHFELIFDALERSVLIGDLSAEFTVLCLERGDALFERGKVDGRRGWRWPMGRRGHEVGDDCADIAIEQGQDSLNEGQTGPDGVDNALNAGGNIHRCGLGGWQAAAEGEVSAGLGGAADGRRSELR
jgi:hypothetical protein